MVVRKDVQVRVCYDTFHNKQSKCIHLHEFDYSQTIICKWKCVKKLMHGQGLPAIQLYTTWTQLVNPWLKTRALSNRGHDGNIRRRLNKSGFHKRLARKKPIFSKKNMAAHLRCMGQYPLNWWDQGDVGDHALCHVWQNQTKHQKTLNKLSSMVVKTWLFGLVLCGTHQKKGRKKGVVMTRSQSLWDIVAS